MRFLVVACALALIAGCGPSSNSGPDASQAAACADGAARLTGTGLCQSEARTLLTADPNVRTPELEGCTWSIKEVMLPVDEFLLYNAATCGERDTRLAFAGGAHSAEIAYESSAAYGQEATGRALVRLFGVDPDPQGALIAAIAETPAAERASCEVQPAQREGLPADALIIAPNARARARFPAGQPVVACGPMGVDETKQSYWRVRQGFAWYFDLGAQDPDIDAGNMTIITRGADGAWQVKS